MIFRKQQTPQPAPVEAKPARPGNKGRPTRTRKEAEAARRRPLVVDNRKEARKRDRERRAAANREAQQALLTGDERKMPLQHRGPERRLVRDLVDSRRNIAEYFLPFALVVMLVVLIVPLLRPQLLNVMSTVVVVVLWGGMLLCVVDGFLLRRVLRLALIERYGEVERGLVGYGIMRQIQIRRFRLPRPVIAHGQEPR
ncbi:DUF3043 domain-containing protein [Brachybacterium sp. Marseille-Q7125]|uniref:DUF3043 domain-containing protein n=1 Tax=Brachybacterium sp. Marseille-Q7125 TaxID=2932815 RepID=UPI001FF222A5